MGRATDRDSGTSVGAGPRLRPGAWALAAVVVAAAVGWAGARTRPFTAGANLLVFGLASAVAVVALVQWRRPGRLPDPLRRHPVAVGSGAAWPWWGLAGLVVVVELAQLVQLPRRSHPTISSLVGPALLHADVRGVVIAAWVLFGLWMVRR